MMMVNDRMITANMVYWSNFALSVVVCNQFVLFDKKKRTHDKIFLQQIISVDLKDEWEGQV